MKWGSGKACDSRGFIFVDKRGWRRKTYVNMNPMENIALVGRGEAGYVCVFRHCIYEDIFEASILSHCGLDPFQAGDNCVSM